MPAAATIREQKKVTISSKRQFTIPQKFFSALGFEREAVCTLGDGMLIIQPAKPSNDGEFAEQILLAEFKKRQSKVRPAVEQMLQAAKDAANGVGEFSTHEDIFGEDY